MSDIGNPEASLNFEPRPTPKSTHNNWVMRKLEDYTMERESKIKGETMGLDIKSHLLHQMNYLLQAAFVNEARYYADTGIFDTASFLPLVALAALSNSLTRFSVWFPPKGHKA